MILVIEAHELWDRDATLNLGTKLYDASCSFPSRRSEFREIAGDIMTKLPYLSALCISNSDLEIIDPFKCRAEDYDVSTSLVSVCLCLNTLSVWKGKVVHRHDKMRYLCELWVVLSVVDKAIDYLTQRLNRTASK